MKHSIPMNPAMLEKLKELDPDLAEYFIEDPYLPEIKDLDMGTIKLCFL